MGDTRGPSHHPDPSLGFPALQQHYPSYPQIPNMDPSMAPFTMPDMPPNMIAPLDPNAGHFGMYTQNGQHDFQPILQPPPQPRRKSNATKPFACDWEDCTKVRALDRLLIIFVFLPANTLLRFRASIASPTFKDTTGYTPMKDHTHAVGLNVGRASSNEAH